MNRLINVTADEIKVGDKASYTKTCSSDDVVLFARISGDVNPIHLNEPYARTTQFGRRIAHGMYTSALVSAAVALRLPGPGSVYLGQETRFSAPVFIDDTITVELEVESVREDKPIAGILFTCTNQDGKKVASGKATILVPKDKVDMEMPVLPDLTIGHEQVL